MLFVLWLEVQRIDSVVRNGRYVLNTLEEQLELLLKYIRECMRRVVEAFAALCFQLISFYCCRYVE